MSSTTDKKKYLSKGKDKTQAPKEKKAKKSKQSSITFDKLEAQRQAEKKAEKKSTDLTERERYLDEKRKKEQM